MNEQTFIDEYKSRFRIFHSSEDLSIGQQLESGFADIKSIIGEFDPTKYEKGKELVYDNFQMMIMDASIDIVGDQVAD